MAYPLSQGRSSRRRRRLGVVLVVVVSIVLVAIAVWFRSERRDVTTYLDAAKQVAEDHDDLSVAMTELFQAMADLERQDFLNRFAQFSATAVAQEVKLQEAPVPGVVAAANGFLQVAVRSWGGAIEAIDGAIIDLIDDPQNRDALELLRRSFDLLRVGDVAYSGFLGEVADLDPELVTFEYPPVAYLRADRQLLFDADLMAERLQRFAGLQQFNDISVTGATRPQALGVENQIPVIPFSDQLDFVVVVSNVGNLPAADLEVELRIVNATGALIEPMTINVADLAPQSSTTIVFEAVPIQPGGPYEAIVSVMHPDDRNPDNNVWNLVFFWNEAA